MMNDKLSKANDTQIYDLTGCISTCHKYYYDVQPMSDLKVQKVFQVNSEIQKLIRYSLDYVAEQKSVQAVGSLSQRARRGHAGL